MNPNRSSSSWKLALVGAALVLLVLAGGARGLSHAENRSESTKARLAKSAQPANLKTVEVSPSQPESPPTLPPARYQRDLPKPGMWEGTTPIPGSEVRELLTMPELEGELAPVVALTFDDGPSQYTPEVLKILQREQVPATFFMLGENVLARPDDAKAVADAGFSIGAHTMTHPDLETVAPRVAEAEIADSIEAIDGVVGTGRTRCLRVPYGSFDADILKLAAKYSVGLVNWDIDSLDWQSPDADGIVARTTVPGQRQLILLHDGGGDRTATVEALPRIIDHYQAQGARFISLCDPVDVD
ncbi:MAG: polysaccharide deacetylase family protein [Microthrixaceae bacterium]